MHVVIAIGIFLLGGVGAWGIAVAIFAHGLAHPPRMTDGKAVYLLGRLSPADLGMEFEDVKFDVADMAAAGKISIGGWWIPLIKSGRTVILLHGFADAKVGVIAWAIPWRELGYNILAIDLRAHGESGGRYSTAGYFERQDVAQIIDQLRAQRPDQTRHIVLFGVSLGAAVAVATAALRDNDAQDRPARGTAKRGEENSGRDIDAIVLDSPFVDYRDAVMIHAGLLRLPARLVAPTAIWLVEKITGARFDDIAPRRLLPLVRCPLLIIAGEKDLFFDPGAFDGRAVKIFPGAGHLLAFTSAPQEYRETLMRFLDESLPSTSA